jgi:hypothetical protein
MADNRFMSILPWNERYHLARGTTTTVEWAK